MAGFGSAISDSVSSPVDMGIGIYQFFKGLQQEKEAKEIAKENPFSPEVMPWEVQYAATLAQQNFTNGMPGMNTAKQSINQNAANAGAVAAKGAAGSGDVLDAAQKIQLNSDDATRKLALQAASYKSDALAGYQGQLGNVAQWKSKLYKNNQLDPYLRAANLSAAMYGAGQQNEFKGIDTFGQGIEAGAASGGEAIDSVMGSGGSGGSGGGMNTGSLLSLAALL